jgi:plasmid replication initiation protein
MQDKIKKVENYFGKSVQIDKTKETTGYITGVEKFTTDDAIRLAFLQFEFEVKRSGVALTIHLTHNTKIRVQ